MVPEIVAIIPLHNHARTVCDVLDGVAAAGIPALVVDDGSTDGGAIAVERWIVAAPGKAELVRLARNQGKAAALLRGLREADARGASIAVTIDADGQHETARIADFVAASAGGRALVIGNRAPIPRDYPLPRLVGRMLSGLAVRAACGAVVHDAACGFRAYPVKETLAVRCLSGRYAWEEEVIARLAWRGVTIREVLIPVIYRDPSIARSHYRFGRDWTEGTLVLAGLVVERVLNPRARWSPDGAGWAEMGWPAARGNPLTVPLALLATGIAATVVALARLIAPAASETAVSAAAMIVVGIAAVRVRAPALPTAAGALLGWIAPPIAAVAYLPLSIALTAWSIARMRPQGSVVRDA